MKQKIFIVFILMIVLVFLSSCAKRLDYELVGNIAEIKKLTPVCIIWYKPGKTGWEVNKFWGLNELDEMVRIKKLLTEPEKSYPYWDPKYKLSLIFYDGNLENLKLWEVFFDIRGKTFVGSVGVSRELGELFSKYLEEEASPVLPGMDPNRVKEVQERMRKKVKELEKQRQSEEQSE